MIDHPLDLFSEPEQRQLGISPESWIPETNEFGGWYGREARPGDTAVAFVAERVNENRVAPNWPPLYGGASGLYIWRAVAKAGIRPHKCYYTNAAKPPGKVKDLYSELYVEVIPDVVIALGDYASSELWASGVSHLGIPHPAYWKRFHWGDFDRYVQWIREITDAKHVGSRHADTTTCPRCGERQMRSDQKQCDHCRAVDRGQGRRKTT